jgi:hypothetical protein
MTMEIFGSVELILLQMAKYGNGEAGGNSQFVCTISHALTLGRYWH